MIDYDSFVETAMKFTFLKFSPRDPEDLLEKFNSFKFIENEIGSNEDLYKGLIAWSKNHDVFPSHIELRDVLLEQNPFTDSSRLLEMERENRGLIKGRSVEVGSSKAITPKQARFLNDLYWNSTDEIQMSDLVSKYPEPRHLSISDHDDIKLWLGRGHGELILKTTKDIKGVKTTAQAKAIENIKQVIYLDEELAKKYLALNQDGFFEEEKKDDIKQHWSRRVGIDLSKYKDILKLMDVKEEAETKEKDEAIL